jgi:hypothetical protein
MRGIFDWGRIYSLRKILVQMYVGRGSLIIHMQLWFEWRVYLQASVIECVRGSGAPLRVTYCNVRSDSDSQTVICERLNSASTTNRLCCAKHVLLNQDLRLTGVWTSCSVYTFHSSTVARHNSGTESLTLLLCSRGFQVANTGPATDYPDRNISWFVWVFPKQIA